MPAILLATQVPVPQSGSSDYNLTLGPLGARTIAPAVPTLVEPFNENAARVDILGRWGGGVYAVLNGLTLSSGGGLVCTVATGNALIDALVRVSVAQNRTLDDATRNHLWIRRDGTITHRTDTASPGTDYCYLGSALTAAGAISSFDTSGVVYLRGGLPWRQTADVSTPGDAPAATISFLSQGASKLWLWSPITPGYFEIASSSGAFTISQLSKASANGTVTLTAGESQATNIEITLGTASAAWVLEITVAGSPAVAAGTFWMIYNASFYGVRIAKAGSSAEHAVLNSFHRGIFYYDGSEIREAGRDSARWYTASISADYTPVRHEADADFLSIVSNGVRNVNLPITAGWEGRVTWVHADESQSGIIVRAAGESAAEKMTRVLPGEVQPFVQDGGSGWRLGSSRPYWRVMTHEMTTDLDYPLTNIEAVHFVIEITDTVPTLTGGKNIILPTMIDKGWFVVNETGQTLTFKTSGGTGVAVPTTKYAMLYCNGTNIKGAVFP